MGDRAANDNWKDNNHTQVLAHHQNPIHALHHSKPPGSRQSLYYQYQPSPLHHPAATIAEWQNIWLVTTQLLAWHHPPWGLACGSQTEHTSIPNPVIASTASLNNIFLQQLLSLQQIKELLETLHKLIGCLIYMLAITHPSHPKLSPTNLLPLNKQSPLLPTPPDHSLHLTLCQKTLPQLQLNLTMTIPCYVWLSSHP